MSRFFPLFVLLVAALPVASAQTFADYPRTKIQYYHLSATTADGLRVQMRQRGPNYVVGDHVAARAYYTFNWVVTERGPKRCNARVRIKTRVIFPKHTNLEALPPRLRYDWDRFIVALEKHEMGHIRLAYDAMPRLKAALENGPCKTAYRRAAKVERELERKQEAFDADPANRARGGLYFP